VLLVHVMPPYRSLTLEFRGRVDINVYPVSWLLGLGWAGQGAEALIEGNGGPAADLAHLPDTE
jgi:hypothetical protein